MDDRIRRVLMAVLHTVQLLEIRATKENMGHLLGIIETVQGLLDEMDQEVHEDGG